MARIDHRLVTQALTNIVKNATESIEAVGRLDGELGHHHRRRSRAARRGDHRRGGQRQGPAGRGPRAAARALHDDAREGHRARSRHRAEDHGGARRLDRAPRRARGRERRARRADAADLSASKRRRNNRSSPPRPRPADEDQGEQPWRRTFSLSTTKPTSARSLPESSRTKGTPRARPATATARSRRSRTRRPSLIFLDIWLQGSRLDGLSLLDEVHRQHPDLPVVIISGHGNIETAVSAIKRGAYDYIEKPFKADRLVLVAAARAGGVQAAGARSPS